jgi:SAM-dependent methyltransferase
MSDPSDPSQPTFWNERYAAGRTPWESSGVPPRLARFLAAHPRGGRVLVPGCGRGQEVAAFAAAGWDALALDFSAEAIAQARAAVRAELADRIVLGDFFTHPFAAGSFDLVYERTFFCALPPSRRAALLARTATLLRPGGLLVGFYYTSEETGGPPYALHAADHDALFTADFVPERDEPVAEPHPLFGADERWREYRRR